MGGHSASRLSLLGHASGRWLCHRTLQSALAHLDYSIDWLIEQVCGNSSPRLEAGGLLATEVEYVRHSFLFPVRKPFFVEDAVEKLHRRLTALCQSQASALCIAYSVE